MIKDRWHKPEFAERWDRESLIGNPTRAEQLDILITVVSDHYREGQLILDLGMGSGQVEEMIIASRPEARIVGVDSSSAMLNLARKRLGPMLDNCTIIRHDLADIDSLILPRGPYHFALSVQTMHELRHADKKAIFRRVFEELAEEGVFLILDRLEIDYQALNRPYASMWNRLERIAIPKANMPYEEFVSQYQRKSDFPAHISELLAWLGQTGFVAECLHLHFNRALVGAVKPAGQNA